MTNNEKLKKVMENLSEDLRELMAERAKIDDEIKTIIPIMGKVNEEMQKEE